jgi:hypothetical protein
MPDPSEKGAQRRGVRVSTRSKNTERHGTFCNSENDTQRLECDSECGKNKLTTAEVNNKQHTHDLPLTNKNKNTRTKLLAPI